jgi:hypothetical protein
MLQLYLYRANVYVCMYVCMLYNENRHSPSTCSSCTCIEQMCMYVCMYTCMLYHKVGSGLPHACIQMYAGPNVPHDCIQRAHSGQHASHGVTYLCIKRPHVFIHRHKPAHVYADSGLRVQAHRARIPLLFFPYKHCTIHSPNTSAHVYIDSRVSIQANRVGISPLMFLIPAFTYIVQFTLPHFAPIHAVKQVYG